MKKQLLLIALALLVVIWGGKALAQASGVSIDVETIPAKKIRGTFVYSVKFVCGQQAEPSAPDPISSSFVPGRFRTAINIHNPQSRSVSFTTTGVRTQSNFPPSTGPHTGTPVAASLGADQGGELSCEDVMTSIDESNKDIFVNFTFTGFVVIRASDELDVVGVYTAEVSSAGGT
jgi:hypothetical protein